MGVLPCQKGSSRENIHVKCVTALLIEMLYIDDTRPTRGKGSTLTNRPPPSCKGYPPPWPRAPPNRVESGVGSAREGGGHSRRVVR